MGDELGRAGIDGLVHRNEARPFPLGAHRVFVHAEQPAQPRVGEAHPFRAGQEAGRQPADDRGRVRSLPRIRFAYRGRGAFHLGFAVDDLGDVPQEPGVDAGALVQFVHVHAQPQGVGHGPQPPGVGDRQRLAQRGEPCLRCAGRGREAGAVDLQRTQRLVQRLLERAADRHGLADRLHLRPEQVARLRELVEREAR